MRCVSSKKLGDFCRNVHVFRINVDDLAHNCGLKQAVYSLYSYMLYIIMYAKY